jgi:hypothetical protein
MQPRLTMLVEADPILARHQVLPAGNEHRGLALCPTFVKPVQA